MGQGILVDTNTAIDYLADLLPVNAVEIIEGAKSNISVVTRIELLSWPNATTDDTNMLSDFITDCIVIELSEPVITKTIEVRKKYKLKLGDAVIAATALQNELKLYTRNVKHFDKVPELKIVNPYLL